MEPHGQPDAGHSQPPGAPETAPSASAPRRAPTVHDVARVAKVSIGTVSKVLNDRGDLRRETRERVRAAAEQLGFRRNELVQSLLRGRSFTVGLLTTDIYGRFSIPLLDGIEDALGSARVSVFLCSARDDPAREQQHLESLLAKQVDGIIVTGRRIDPRTPIDIGRSHTPVLYAFTQVAVPGALCLLPDEAQGARLATEHLFRSGRRRLAHVTGPGDFEAVHLRAEAMCAVADAYGAGVPKHRIVSGPWDENWAYDAACVLLERDPAIDAIFCGSDLLARGVADALRERGVRVPDDVALVGFDNWEIISAKTRPPLTTVDLNLHELGCLAGAKLLAMIDDRPESGTFRLPCSLVIRASCGGHPPDSPHIPGQFGNPDQPTALSHPVEMTRSTAPSFGEGLSSRQQPTVRGKEAGDRKVA